MGGIYLAELNMRRHSAFTLIELVAAVAVLALILLMLSQISGGAIRATNGSLKKLDATRQTRAVLDTLTEDLAQLVSTNGASTIFVRNDGPNARLTFVSRRRGPQGMTDLRFLAVTCYLNGTHLVRSVSPVIWSQADLVAEVFRSGTPLDSSELAAGIVRFEIALQLDNGTVVPLHQAGSWITTTWNGTPLPEQFKALQLATVLRDPAKPKVKGLIVAVAALDEGNLKLPGVPVLGSRLDEGTGPTPLEAWNAAISAGKLQGIPPSANAALSLLQKTFSLP